MVIKSEPVNLDLFKRILELAKKQTADIVIIPQTSSEWGRFGYHHIFGTTANTIVAFSRFQSLENVRDPLWSEEAINAIALYYKDISPFLRAIGENGIHQLFLDYHLYTVNRGMVGVGTTLNTRVEVAVKDSRTGEDTTIVPSLSLIPAFDSLQRYFFMDELWSLSRPVSNPIELNDNSEFIEVWNGKASDGAKAWTPNFNKYGIELKPYILYLSKTMFAFSKNDLVTVEIRDCLPQRPANEFLCKFTVIRTARKQLSQHNYLFMGIKMV